MAATTQDQKQAIRRCILDAASAMLADGGPQALSMRKLASQVGASTMVLYTHFDGKNGLFEALYREAFERFERALLKVPATDDPLQDLVALGKAYREFANQNPTWYALMFGRAFGDFEPSEENRQLSRRTFGILEQFVGRAWELEGSATSRRAAIIWASIHGMIQLQHTGHLPAGDVGNGMFDSQVAALLRAFNAQG